MTKRRRKIDTQPGAGPVQQSLFDYIQRLNEALRSGADTEGTLNIRERLRLSLNRAIKNCGLSRPQISGEMSHLLGADVTKSIIDSWTAESKEGNRIPAEYLPAFCQVTGSNEPIEILNDAAGMFSLPGPDALRSEIQRLAEQERKIRSEKRKREIFLLEMEGKAPEVKSSKRLLTPRRKKLRGEGAK
ncbi:MAG: hypothetical protein APR55_10300 [Methanolinea sp. SDB]|nr:MAG: hypothetical protein APR55_10300 [Methanolinea sp. SDB]